MPFFVYALYNKERKKIYVGQTTDIVKRMARHNGILPNKKKSFTSRMHGEWKFVYSEEYATRKEAIQREKELKSFRGREFIKNKIPSMRS